jgi:mRNA interferase RelE/StbE
LAWSVEVQDNALRQLHKLPPKEVRRILDFLGTRLIKYESPRQIGEALKGAKLGDYWRYRVGDYRIVCDLKDNRLVVLVIEIAHRRDVYR